MKTDYKTLSNSCPSENLVDKKYYYFYLTLLMGAMCKAESTTGHFAQFLDKNNKRYGGTVTQNLLNDY